MAAFGPTLARKGMQMGAAVSWWYGYMCCRFSKPPGPQAR